MVTVCVLLQAASAALARYAYRGVGWHMYSRMACDLRLKDAEQCKKALCQLNLFGALARLDLQVGGCCTRSSLTTTHALLALLFRYTGIQFKAYNRASSGLATRVWLALGFKGVRKRARRHVCNNRASGTRPCAMRALLQVLLLLFLVALSNGLNPSRPSQPIPVLLIAAAVGLPLVAAWLAAGSYAVRRQRQRWAFAAEFSAPLCSALPLLLIFAGGARGRAGVAGAVGWAMGPLFMAARLACGWTLLGDPA
jgi:hypothetical protein